MCRLPGGEFTVGSERYYPEERPLRRMSVDAFSIASTPVTNAQFARFVAATGCVTSAETAPDPTDYPGMPPEMVKAGSLDFGTTISRQPAVTSSTTTRRGSPTPTVSTSARTHSHLCPATIRWFSVGSWAR
jgi:formylglycine-generating enzyme required for sulfatase activity